MATGVTSRREPVKGGTIACRSVVVVVGFVVGEVGFKWEDMATWNAVESPPQRLIIEAEIIEIRPLVQLLRGKEAAVVL